MKKLEDILVGPDEPMLEVIRRINEGAMQIALVTDREGRLLGTITDGDVRRAILRGLPLEIPAREIMNPRPVTVTRETGREQALALLRKRGIHAIPVVDEGRRVIGLELESSLLIETAREAWVVLMAGGKGMRLRPLTEDTPKPMLQVGGKPMLEHIIGRFVEQGFRHFYLSVNYKSEVITEHFGDGSALGCDIRYVHEDKPLGTGGALSLLPENGLSEDIIVMNGDLLTDINFHQLLAYHRDTGAAATICARAHKVNIPYGVIEMEGGDFVGIIEKPSYTHFVNAGIYVLRREVLHLIPRNVFYDLPELFGELKRRGQKVSVFPLHEQWRDIGSPDDFALAQQESAEDEA